MNTTLTTGSGTIDLGRSALEGRPIYGAPDPDNRDGAYTYRITFDIGGYGTNKQARAAAERIRKLLTVELGQPVALCDVTVNRNGKRTEVMP